MVRLTGGELMLLTNMDIVTYRCVWNGCISLHKVDEGRPLMIDVKVGIVILDEYGLKYDYEATNILKIMKQLFCLKNTMGQIYNLIMIYTSGYLKYIYYSMSITWNIYIMRCYATYVDDPIWYFEDPARYSICLRDLCMSHGSWCCHI